MKPKYTLINPRDIIPLHSPDLNSKHDREKVLFLYNEFKEKGFDPAKGVIIAYP